MPLPLFVVVVGLLGLIVGSFLNVVAHRLPRGASIVRPRSRCPWCRAPLAARDNVPVVSWLLLGGRCRACGGPIGWRYPAVEAITGALFAAAAWRFGPTLALLPALVLLGLLVVLAAIDLERLLLPDRITLPALVVGLALQPAIPEVGLASALAGAVLGAGVLILLINFWYLIRGEEGMGLGDVNMLAMIGAFLGWQGVAVTLLVAVLTGSVAGLVLLAGGRLGWRSQLPFGLFLALGGAVALFFGPRLLGLYLGLL